MDFDAQKLFICAEDGIISGIDSTGNRFYVTTPSFPGNNGGIFVNKRRTNKSKDSEGKDPFIYLGGVVTEYHQIKNGPDDLESHSTQPICLGLVVQ